MFNHSPACILGCFRFLKWCCVLILHNFEEVASEVFKHPSSPELWRFFLWLQRSDVLSVWFMDLLRLFQRNLKWRAVLWLKWGWEDRWVSGGREGDVRHITIQLSRHHTPLHRLLTSHSISPSGATSISMSFCPSSFSRNSDLFVCPAQLFDSKVLLWFCESREAYCYSSRCLCVWSALIAALCFWCSTFALASTWLHTQALFAAVFLNHVISGFTDAVCLIPYTREMMTEIYRLKYFFCIDVYNKGLKAHLKGKK